MKTIEEFFKNRIYYGRCFDVMGDHGFNREFEVKWAFNYEGEIYNPLSLNITNSFDLVEKLTPLFYFIVSYLEKFKNENNYNSGDTIKLYSYFSSHIGGDIYRTDSLFDIKFMFDDLTSVNVLQKIKLRIEKAFKKRHFNFVFNTKPIKVSVAYTILYPPDDARRIREEFYEEDRRRRAAWAEEREKEEALKRINNQINGDQTFKSDECVICITNSPVLFCNCGHLCVCVECDKVKSLNTCQVCKIEITIKRNI